MDTLVGINLDSIIIKCNTFTMNKLFISLLCFVPLALVAELFKLPPLLIFFLSTTAIIPLARFIGESTEELSTHMGTGLGSILNATFGNATEMILAVFAINAGLVGVVKASITGSIIGNLLLVLGLSIFAGGLRFKKQLFNKTIAQAAGSTMFIALVALVVPAVFLLTSPHIGNPTVNSLSILVAICMLVVYISSIIFMLVTHKHLYLTKIGKEEANWSVRKGILVLLSSTLLVAILSEILVGTIEPVTKALGWTEVFVGVIFLAIIGNAAENASAILMAVKNKMDLALQISFGSATQIALFVVPVLIIISFAVGKPMNLIFSVIEIVAIVFSVLISYFVTQDGETHWLKGLQLVVAYLIMGVVFFLVP